MKFLLSILVLSAVAVLGINAKCSNNPSDWCETYENAKQCDVVEQCIKNVWLYKKEETKKPVTVDNDLVNFTLYYETLCPDCRGFMKGQLWTAYTSVASIMNLTVVPYGNAKETWRNETQLWQFSCQHGSDECWGNLLHSCLIYYYPQTDDHLPYIHCMEIDDADDIRMASIKCAKNFPKISYNTLTTCMNSKLGNNLQHANALQTEALNPPHKYVPWVTLNGVHTEDIEQQAEADLVGLICKTYQGSNVPAACKQRLAPRKCTRD